MAKFQPFLYKPVNPEKKHRVLPNSSALTKLGGRS